MRIVGALLLAVTCMSPGNAAATVTTTTRTVTYTGSGGTTFTVPFKFYLAGDLVVKKRTIATGVTVTLTQGVSPGYTVVLATGTGNGSIAVAPAVSSSYQIIISRVVPYTQTTSFTTSGPFLALAVETALDRTVMMVQQLIAGVAVDSDITTAVAAHAAAADPHTGYLLLAGRSGGQHAYGGTAASDTLWLTPTSNATQGKLKFGTTGTELVLDDANDRVGIGTATPDYALDVRSDVAFGDTTRLVMGSEYIVSPSDGTSAELQIGAADSSSAFGAYTSFYGASHSTRPSWIDFHGANFRFLNTAGAVKFTLTPSTGMIFAANQTLVLSDDVNSWVQTPTIYGGTTASHTLQIFTTTNGTKGKVLVGSAGTELVVDDANDRVGIGTASPTNTLEVRGTISGRHVVEFPGATDTVDANTDCGTTFFVSGGGDTTITLPALASANQGCTITVQDIAADGVARARLSPNAADKIRGTCMAVTFSGTADRDAWNTLATSKNGDFLTVVANWASNPGWYVQGCVGVWASEP